MHRSRSNGLVREPKVLKELLAVVPILKTSGINLYAFPLNKAVITYKVGFVAQGAKALLERRAFETAGTIVIELDPVHLSPLLDT